MMYRAFAQLLVLATAAASSASALPVTATFEGMALRDLKVEVLVSRLRSQGAILSKESLYKLEKVKRPAPSGNVETDKKFDKLYDYLDALGSGDPLASEFDIRLRKPIDNLGLGEIKISSCPADGSVAGVSINYPRSVQTPRHFVQITRRLSDKIGRSPDRTSRERDTIVVDWEFRDSTMIRAVYNNPRGGALGRIPPVSVNYIGSDKSQLCRLNFIQPR